MATRLRFWLGGEACRGAGRPAAKEMLDEQYRSGGWSRLDTLEQMPPCMIVAGYIHQLFRAPRVLDVGCGHGRLAKLLHHFPMRSYQGIDLSSEAIGQAMNARIDGAKFIATDFELWVPTGTYDVVVFLDSLYYSKDPVATLRRYSGVIDRGGALIVSMYRYSNNALIQRSIVRHFGLIHETTLRCQGKRWDVQVLRPDPGG